LRICLEFPLARFQVCDSAKSGHPKVTTQRQDKFIRALSLRNQTLNACTFSHELRTITGDNLVTIATAKRERTCQPTVLTTYFLS
jgi:hypothetical protein